MLKKIEGLPLEKIAPLHGPVLRENLAHYIKLYDIWSSYEPEEDGIVIAYNSVYGHTAKAVKVLCDTYIPENVRVEVFDLARADRSAAIAAAFRYSKLVLAGTTYNNGLFPCMKEFIDGLTERNYQKRTVGFIENGSWAPTSAKNMKAMLEQSKNITFCENTVTIKSEIIQENKEQLSKLAAELCQ